MKPLAVAGLVLVVLGAVILVRGLSYPSQHSMMKVGDFQVTTTENRAIPPWAGGAVIVGGIILFGAGISGRKII